MNKLVLILCAFFYFFTLNVSAETVNKITISGNKRISDETIKVLGGISDLSEIDKSNLNDLLKKLYDTNFFDDIKISLSNKELNIIVVENPIIEVIEITGIKNKDFIKSIIEVMSLKDRMSFSACSILVFDIMLLAKK